MIRRYLQKFLVGAKPSIKPHLVQNEENPETIIPPVTTNQPQDPGPFTPPYIDDGFELLMQVWQSAARNVADRGDHRVITPFDRKPSRDPGRPLKIGLFGNLANQAFINARALRRLGYDVEVVLQEDNIDDYPLSQPYWEDLEIEVQDSIASTARPDHWQKPDYVRVIAFDTAAQQKYQHRYSAVAEVRDLYEKTTGQSLSRDAYFLLSQWMGHWDYIAAMNDYDVVQLSMWPICLGAFCPKPYVVCPLGGDLYITAFQQDVQGLLFRAGFRSASHIAVAETDYPLYLDRLATTAPRSFMPLIVDTDIYHEGNEAETRAQWQEAIGGSRYLLSVCRQSWDWKGSDRVIRAFAEFFHDGGEEWRLLLQAWGDDYEKSRALVSELGIDHVTAWLPMCSKPLLRRRQRAADVVCDQFVMEGYGASVLESLAAGTPVLMIPVPEEAAHHFRSGLPPLVGAKTQSEIATALRRLKDDAFRTEIGKKSRRWVEEEHGYRQLAERFVAMFEKACVWNSELAKPESGSPDDRGAGNARTTLNDLAEMHRMRRDEIRDRWHRTLPFADQISDRWEKARFLGFGDGTSIYDSTLVIGDVSVGQNTWIGPNCVLDGSAGLKIGSTCSISSGCQLYSHDTVAWAVSGGVASGRHAETTVGDAVYIGPGTIVAAGSTIGAHCIVGALSLVKGDIPPYSFAAGSPARIVGRVEIGADGQVSIETLKQADSGRAEVRSP